VRGAAIKGKRKESICAESLKNCLQGRTAKDYRVKNHARSGIQNTI